MTPTESALRQTAIQRTGLIDAEAYRQFDRIAEIICQLIGAPVAVVSVVLHDRQVFIGQHGMPEPWASLGETPLTHSFCQHVVKSKSVLWVTDATQHPLLADNLAIDALGVHAYLGVPLNLRSGEVIGAVAVIDSVARDWTKSEEDQRHTLGEVVRSEIVSRISEVKWRTLFEEMQEGYLLCRLTRDLTGEVVDFVVEDGNSAAAAMYGLPREQLIAATGAANGRLGDLLPALDAAVKGDQALSFEIVMNGAKPRWIEGRVKDTGRDLVSVILSDISDRKCADAEREARRVALNAELSHRLKNAFALVAALVGQTLRSELDIAAARTKVAERIIALSRAHDVLVSDHIKIASITAILRDLLVAIDPDHVQIRLDGPEITLGPKASLHLALLVHELATNAAKYGALSVSTGRVHISWSVGEANGTPELTFTWVESGGPAVKEPTRSGLGTRLLLASFGTPSVATMDYQAEGVQYRVVADLATLRAE